MSGFDPELTAEGLRAERFTPRAKVGIFDMPVIDPVLGGVHNRVNSDYPKLRRFALQLWADGYAKRWANNVIGEILNGGEK